MMSQSSPVPYKSLRLAWNSFARLIDVDYKKIYRCDYCGDNPDTIICDATFLGFRKDLLPAFMNNSTKPDSDSNPVKGSKHKDRVYLSNKRTRDLLKRISGIDVTKGAKGRRRKVTSASKLNNKEYKELMKLLTKENPSLHALLIEACADCRQQYVVPRAYSDFLFELSRNGPVCGMLQIGGNDEVIRLFIQVLRLAFLGIRIAPPLSRCC